MLRVNNLVGFGISRQIFAVTYIDSYLDEVAGTTKTVSVPIGNEPNQVVVVLCYLSGAVTDENSVSGLTINGNAATLIGQATASNTNTAEVGMAAFSLKIGNASNVNIVLTFPVSFARCSFSVFRVTGQFSDTAHDFGFAAGTNSTNSKNTSLDIPAGGAVLAMAGNQNSGDGTWTNATEDEDVVLGANTRVFAAHEIYAAAQTGLTITHSGCQQMCAVSFR